MPFRPSVEQKQLIKGILDTASYYRWTYRLGHDTPVAISIPTGAEELWCEQIEQILSFNKIYVSSEGEELT